MSISGCWWKEIKGLNNIMLNNDNKGEQESDKREVDQVYTHPTPNSKPEPLGTAIAIARNMPTFDLGENMDEGQRLEMIEEYIKKNGAKLCKQGESGNGNKGLSPWSRIRFSADPDTHPLDRQEKESRGHKKKKDKKKVNKRKRSASN